MFESFPHVVKAGDLNSFQDAFRVEDDDHFTAELLVDELLEVLSHFQNGWAESCLITDRGIQDALNLTSDHDISLAMVTAWR